jgi:hypothetical protein
MKFTKRYFPLVFCLFTIFLFSACSIALAEATTMNIKAGDWLKYYISSSDPSFDGAKELVNVTSVNALDVAVTFKATVFPKTGSSISGEGFWSLARHETAFTYSLIGYVLPSNLQAGDAIPYVGWKVNNTETIALSGGSHRETNHIILINASTNTSPINLEVYWDKSTGVVEKFTESGVGSSGAFSVDISLVDSSFGWAWASDLSSSSSPTTSSSASASVSPSSSIGPSPTISANPSSSPSLFPSPSIPEFPSTILVTFSVVAVLTGAIIYKRKQVKKAN